MSGVPHHVIRGIAVLLQIALLQETRLHGKRARYDLLVLVARRRFHILDNQVRGVRPLLDEQLVVQVSFDDHVHPSKGHRVVRAGTQGQPQVGLFAMVGHARIDEDMRLGLLGHIDDRSARIIVIRALRRRAPRNVNLRTRHVLLPRKGIARVQRRAEETRAFAHLPRDRHVGRTDQLAQGAVGEHAPLAGRARHAEHGQPRVLLGRLLELLRDRRERLFPADANPTGIVVVLGIGAFHGVVQPIGMIGGLNGRLRLVAAIAHRLEGALVSLDTDSSTVLNGHPNTAFHFAARATARSHSLNIIRSAAFHIRLR